MNKFSLISSQTINCPSDRFFNFKTNPDGSDGGGVDGCVGGGGIEWMKRGNSSALTLKVYR